MSGKEITEKLYALERHNCKYAMMNCYLFQSDWESDLFIQKRSLRTYEYEVKISKQDFLADFKKPKHKAFEGVLKDNKNIMRMPNHFSFVAPKGMINPEIVPSYAALIEVEQHKSNFSFIVAKNAPLLHNIKFLFDEQIALRLHSERERMYWEMRQLRDQVKSLRHSPTFNF